MSAEFWITTVAIVIGPVIAVLVSQQLQERQSRRDRQLFVLRSLMGTRRAQLSQERVLALNLVEIEFAQKKQIIEAFQALLVLYNDRPRWLSKDEAVQRQLSDDIDEKSVRLIQNIAKCLGYEFDQMDIMRGGYYPEAFGIADEQQKIIREFMVGLRQGNLVLPVGVIDYVTAPARDQKDNGEP